MSPWLITSFGLTAGRHLVLTLLALRRSPIAAAGVAAGVVATVVGGRALLAASRRPASRQRPPS
jgi:hypothetical protein